MPRSIVRRADSTPNIGGAGHGFALALDYLLQEWRLRAELLRAHGAEASAMSLERAATELAAVVNSNANEVLTPTEAARETNYNRQSITRLIRQGRLENVGRPHAPRVRRADLANLTGARSRVDASQPSSLPSIAREALATKVTAARGADR